MSFYCDIEGEGDNRMKNYNTVFTVLAQNRFSTIKWELLRYYRAIAELSQARYRAVLDNRPRIIRIIWISMDGMEGERVFSGDNYPR